MSETSLFSLEFTTLRAMHLLNHTWNNAFWHVRRIEKLDRSYNFVTQMVIGFSCHAIKKRLCHFSLFTLEEHNLPCGYIQIFKVILQTAPLGKF